MVTPGRPICTWTLKKRSSVTRTTYVSQVTHPIEKSRKSDNEMDEFPTRKQKKESRWNCPIIERAPESIAVLKILKATGNRTPNGRLKAQTSEKNSSQSERGADCTPNCLHFFLRVLVARFFGSTTCLKQLHLCLAHKFFHPLRKGTPKTLDRWHCDLCPRHVKIWHPPVCQKLQVWDWMHVWKNMFLQTCWGWGEAQQEVKERVVRKDRLHYWRSLHNWVVYLKILIRESLFDAEKENWDQNHAVKFSKATWHQMKIRERKGPSQGIVQKWEPHGRSPCAPKIRRKITWGNFAPRKTRPQSGMGLGETIYKLKNPDKASFYSSIEAKVNGGTYFKISRRVRIRSRFRSVNVHDEEKKT